MCFGGNNSIFKRRLFQVRSKNKFVTDKLAAALDRCKISDRDAVHILLATVESFDINN